MPNIQPPPLPRLAPYIPPVVRVNPYISRTYQAYQYYNDWRRYLHPRGMDQPPRGTSRSLVWYEYTKNASCGGGGGPVTSNQGWPNCTGQFVAGPPYTTPPNLPIWAWGKYVKPVNQFSKNGYYEPGFKLEPNLNIQPGDRRTPQYQNNTRLLPSPRTGMPSPPSLHPGAPPTNNPLPHVPTVLVPYVPDGPGRDTGPRPAPRPTVSGQPDTHVHRRPDPYTRERKARVAPEVMRMLDLAHGITEGRDAIEALWDALPEDVRNQTPRSGRLRKGARLGEGTRYHTTWDKAQAVYNNLDRMNLTDAVRNLLVNHLTDAALGRINARADQLARNRLGGNRFVRPAGG